MDAFTLIRSLGKEGKSPLEIARELHKVGATTGSGAVISPAVVSGFLRFLGSGSDASYLPTMFGPLDGKWGARRQTKRANSSEGTTPIIGKIRRNKRHGGTGLTDDFKAEVARLYQRENKKVDEIAKALGVHPRKISAFCAMLSGLAVPPGELTMFIDEHGREVTQCPPAFAHGASPQRNVGMGRRY